MYEAKTSVLRKGNNGEFERRPGRGGRGARARPRGGGPREGQEGWQMGEGRKSKGRGETEILKNN